MRILQQHLLQQSCDTNDDDVFGFPIIEVEHSWSSEVTKGPINSFPKQFSTRSSSLQVLANFYADSDNKNLYDSINIHNNITAKKLYDSNTAYNARGGRAQESIGTFLFNEPKKKLRHFSSKTMFSSKPIFSSKPRQEEAPDHAWFFVLYT